jgi:integrase
LVYTQKRGKGDFPYRVFYKKPNGDWTSESGFSSEEAALNHGHDQEAAGRAGTWTDPRKAATPFGEWAAAWMATRKVAPSTAATRRRYLNTYILPEYEYTPVGSLNRFAVRTWAEQLTCAESVRTGVVGLISTILTAAADADMLGANPIYRLQLGKAGDQNVQAAEQERIWAYPEHAVELAARLWPTQRGPALMVLSAAFLGPRWGEICALHRDNCCVTVTDMSGGRPLRRTVIRIDPKVGALHEVSMLEHKDPDDESSPIVERTKVFLGPPKPPGGARSLDVPGFLVTLFEYHLERWKYDYVFAGAQGAWWRRSNWGRRIMRPACDGRPGKPGSQGHPPIPAWEPLLPGLEMHGLRHGHKTAMVEDGVPQKLRDEQMGHKKPPGRESIEDRYTHVTEVMRIERLAALTRRFDKGRAGLAVDPWTDIL